MDKTQEIPVTDVIFREDLYPRIETNVSTVQKYADDLDVLPPIEVNQHNELIDGWHRWTAHKKAKVETIRVSITQTRNESHFLELAIERNSKHGLQLSKEDKKEMARKIYNMTPDKERDGKKDQLAKMLSVSKSLIYEWLGRIDKDSKAARDKRIFELWLACRTQEEIAEQEGITKETVSQIIPDLQKSDKPSVSHQEEEFEPPIYNIWKQQKKSNGSNHFGNTEIRWLDNLLYLYTKPLDIVVDPFAGGGSTIELCKKRLRRYWVSDRKVEPEREKQIRIHDLTDGLPKLHNWKDVKLVYLDPPYWWQAKGAYSQDPADFGNMELEDFNKKLAGLISRFAKKLTEAYIALIIQPTQWNAPEHQFTDHIADMLRTVKLPVEMRFSVPYESQQCNPQMVDWAKANKRCLVLTREIILWRSE
jgi:transcriptional regulator with XRE-family HTH domain